MEKKILSTLICLLFVLSLSAQVTIGSLEDPARAALIDIKTQKPDNENVTTKSGGLVLPRVKLANKTTLDPFIDSTSDPEWTSSTPAIVKALKDAHAGLTVYNVRESLDEPEIDEQFTTGIYVWNGSKWNLTKGNINQKFFYMPSCNLPLSNDDTELLEFDLYAEYERQFTKDGNATFVSSNSSITGLPKFDRSELDYVITSYDDTVITVSKIVESGNNKGELQYYAKSPVAPAGSYINIIFVIIE